ncbi:triose-phosphate isomerase [Patescibacteria group bacterium]|nr:triose-phosphate isomerase [Patescibacteria group bacterium]MBU1922440.1 triose-phosphate isomerase [Patescibacteria group bacterium]
MQSKIIIANWKAYLSIVESEELAKEIYDFAKSKKDLPKIIICPSFPALPSVGKILCGRKNIKLGAQNASWCERGAYTGEVIAPCLGELGCEFVILGHSERRKHFNEKNPDINQRVKMALQNNLTPIVCVGETREEKQAGQRDDVVRAQVIECAGDLDPEPGQKIIIAYEPVWVIGTGQAVAPEDAEHSHQVIKQALVDKYSESEYNTHFQIIYGGSVGAGNLKGFFEKDIIAGVLVGGASAKAQSLKQLIEVCL